MRAPPRGMPLEEISEFLGIEPLPVQPPTREELEQIVGRPFDLDRVEDLAIVERNLDLHDLAYEKSAGRAYEFPVTGFVLIDRDMFHQITALAREAIAARRSP